MAYHFPLMPRIYMAIAQADRYPIVEIMQQTPDIPDTCQWAIFLRNHDELTLEMVTSKERDYMYTTYASDLQARINLGIRRRLAPLMENDLDRIKLMNSLLLSMPGSPIVYYGDEIGMGDNFFIGDRNGVRTPMQWSPDRNAGFSRADPQRLYLPPIMDAVYGYQSTNVEAQSRDPSSLLSWTKRMLAVRKTSQAFGRGTRRFLRPGNRKILAYSARVRRRHHSVRRQPVAFGAAGGTQSLGVQGQGARGDAGPHGVSAHRRVALPADHLGLRLLLVPADHRCRGAVMARANRVDRRAPGAGAVRRLDQPVPRPGRSLAHRHRRERPALQFETDTLPRYIETQRWYAAKGVPASTARASRIMCCGRKARARPSSPGWWRCSTWRAPAKRASYFMPSGAWHGRSATRIGCATCRRRRWPRYASRRMWA